MMSAGNNNNNNSSTQDADLDRLQADLVAGTDVMEALSQLNIYMGGVPPWGPVPLLRC